ncbi:MAG: DNA cytosine methyltransferase [Candidatus Parvarchaeota archaeon]
MVFVGENIQEYGSLKLEYFSLLKKRGIEKGKMRALIGLSTWVHEQESINSGKDEEIMHIEAFSAALEDVSEVKTNFEVESELKRLKNKWVSRPSTETGKHIRRRLLDPPIGEIRSFKHNGLTAVSLFSGAMGLDLGFLAAGFDIRVANDIDPCSRDTVRRNMPELNFIHKDINKVPARELLDEASLSVGDLDVLLGGPPCQPFSPAGKRLGLSDPRASPLKYFVKAINELRPRAFVMEEVPGILSSRLKHFPISERGKRPPTEDEVKGSAFKVILQMLNSTGYKLVYGILNAADFGSPQVRERVLFIGLREGNPTLPEQTHSGSGIPGTLPWNSFWEATADLLPEGDEFARLSTTAKEYMRYVPPGGNWRELPEEFIGKAMGGAYNAGGGKMGFYRRLSWDEPSPALVTAPSQKGTMLVHPEYDRFISVREYARIQGFPDDWLVQGSMEDKYRLIGNAVPVHLSYAVALHVNRLLEGKTIEPTNGIYAYE